jgi:hypothetical protein
MIGRVKSIFSETASVLNSIGDGNGFEAKK